MFKCDLSGSGISLLLAVGTNFTGSGKLFWQWELYSWQWECLVHFIPNSKVLVKPQGETVHSTKKAKKHCDELSSAKAVLIENLLSCDSDVLFEATIQDGRVSIQQIQGRQTQIFVSTGNRGIATTSRGNYADCDELSSSKAVLIENLLSCDSDVLFEQGEDPIDCINKAITFLSVVASRFPPSNNQLRTSSNPRN
nr:hypothetical protein [Tanacetum cinerariifolium]